MRHQICDGDGDGDGDSDGDGVGDGDGVEVSHCNRWHCPVTGAI